MAGPDSVITCEDVKKDLKPFLEDLLKEEEYQAFLKHLEGCPACKKYVNSVDSFSNQLRKLADVGVPADFCSTVLFELKQPEPEPKLEAETELVSEPRLRPESGSPQKYLTGGFLLFFAAAAFFLGTNYFKRSEPQPPQQEGAIAQAPVVKMEEQQESGMDNGQVYELQSGTPDDGIGVSGIAEEDRAVKAGLSEPELLHWHFLYYDKAKELETLRLRRKKRKAESALRKSIEEKKRLQAEIERLKENGEEAAIQQKLEFVKQQDNIIERIKEGNNQIEAELDKALNERRRKEGEPLNIVKSLGIQPDYYDKDALLFSASGGKIKKILDAIGRISQGSSSLRDFTPKASDFSDNDYKVSVYIAKRETRVEHWHVNLAMLSQRAQFISAVKERGGVVTYEFAQELTFSISESKIEDLVAQMPAMRISLFRYGNRMVQKITDTEDEMVDEPVMISVYFTK